MHFEISWLTDNKMRFFPFVHEDFNVFQIIDFQIFCFLDRDFFPMRIFAL